MRHERRTGSNRAALCSGRSVSVHQSSLLIKYLGMNRRDKMNKLRYDGIYYQELSNERGIYLRFYRKGLVTYVILPIRKVNDDLFNLLERNHHNAIGTTKYIVNKNETDIEFTININELGESKLSCKIENDGVLVLNIIDLKIENKIGNELRCDYFKKDYSNSIHLQKKEVHKQEKPQELKTGNFNCIKCKEKYFQIYIVNEPNDEFIAFRCKGCKTIFSYENNKINILKNKVTNVREEKVEENKSNFARLWKYYERKFKEPWVPDPMEE
jgi:hypothetical protein